MSEWARKLEISQNRLLDEAFQVKDYTASFPHVFCKSNKNWIFAFSQDGQNHLSLCACYPVFWQSQTLGWLQGLCLGSVATHLESRGKGLASLVIDQAIEAGMAAGFDFVFLFSESRRLYTQCGFEPVSKDKIFCFERSAYLNKIRETSPQNDFLASNYKNYYFTKQFLQDLNLQQLSEIWRFVCKYSRAAMPILSWSEFFILAKIQGVMVFLLRTSQECGQLLAVCFFEKGADFKNTLYGFSAANDSCALFFANKILEYCFLEQNDFLPEVFLVTEDDELKYFLPVFRQIPNDVFLMIKDLSAQKLVSHSSNTKDSSSRVKAAFAEGLLQVRALQSC